MTTTTKFLLLINLFLCEIVHGQNLEVKNSSCCSFPISALAINPNPENNAYEIASSFGCKIKLWNISNTTFIENYNLVGHTNDVTSICFSPDGDYLASGSADNTVRIWNMILRKEASIFKEHTRPVTQVIYCGSERVASCGQDGKVFLYKKHDTGISIQEVYKDTLPISAIAFNNSNDYLAIGLANGSVKVYELYSNKMISEFNFHSGIITSLAFIPGTTKLISGSTDKNIAITDLFDGKLVSVLHGSAQGVSCCSIIQNETSYRLVSCSPDETMRIWDLNKFVCLKTLYHTGKILSLSASLDESDDNYTRGVLRNTYKPGPYKNIFITGNSDKKINIWSKNDLSNLAEIISVQDTESIIKTPDNYFYCSKNSSPYISYPDKNTPYDIQEVKYNRPDIVLRKLGMDSTHIMLFSKAYRKRLMRLGIDMKTFSDLRSPTLTIQNNIPPSVKEKTIALNLIAEDTLAIIDRIVVYVNSVPEIFSFSKEKAHKIHSVKNIILSSWWHFEVAK